VFQFKRAVFMSTIPSLDKWIALDDKRVQFGGSASDFRGRTVFNV